jgi:hypothetical protein
MIGEVLCHHYVLPATKFKVEVWDFVDHSVPHNGQRENGGAEAVEGQEAGGCRTATQPATRGTTQLERQGYHSLNHGLPTSCGLWYDIVEERTRLFKLLSRTPF